MTAPRLEGSTPRDMLEQETTNAVVVKDGDLFFLTEPDGRVPAGRDHAMGLYYQDCRFLERYELLLAGHRPLALAASAAEGFRSVFELTNPAIELDGHGTLNRQQVAVRWEHRLDGGQCVLHDVITVHNFSVDHVDLPLSLTFASSFEDIFVVRGMRQDRRGTLHPPQWRDGVLELAYDGADGRRRAVSARFAPEPARTDDGTAHYHLALDSEATARIEVELAIRESDGTDTSSKAAGCRGAPAASRRPTAATGTTVESDYEPLDSAVDRSLRDLAILRSALGGREFFAAGVPWYVTLFGRDSLVVALETLAFDAAPAASTLRLLASYQGRKLDEWRDEEPGKIPHELRVGEMAHLGEIPQTPYYGSIDSTPLFLVLLARHAAWTGDLRLFTELREAIEGALDWMRACAGTVGRGYLAYTRHSEKGLGNQGWKDSGDAIMNADGSLATPPIALVEVQGYLYLALRGIADLYRRSGDDGTGRRLDTDADDLRARFNRDFWLPHGQFFALALQEGGRPAEVVASNPGQALWSGIVDAERAQPVVDALMDERMWSGWGIRTLSSAERRYNPIGYHLGTVWPHDNALIAAGCRRYGFDRPALAIAGGLVEAARHFAHHRLPEVFAGFPRATFGVPVRYPVACHPQAWAAGAVPYLLETLLGLEPDAFARTLRVRRPLLPDRVGTLRLRDLRVGDARVDLRFSRRRDGGVAVDVERVTGRLDVDTRADQRPGPTVAAPR